jgi:hypothetical protein
MADADKQQDTQRFEVRMTDWRGFPVYFVIDTEKNDIVSDHNGEDEWIDEGKAYDFAEQMNDLHHREE